ncbi:filamentous hemagglutinin N-terminal domain-containing protein [Alkalinema pantanalense CENA528]|uniref:two-partner secretion domain-containing protein n=1 Tax=Alkalinema pantanalense TaxID=1620705 RepID=UPI003D6F4A11
MRWDFLLGMLGGTIVLGSQSALAQSLIVPDDTLGTQNSELPPVLQSPALNIITSGAIRGNNLFHSFREFNVGEGSSAYFLINSSVRNVLTRVTGNNPSEVLGRLGTFLFLGNQPVPSNANFFLVNPNGVIFGPNSSLDIGGSVVVTTANALQFPNGELFSASLPTVPSQLLTVDPSALWYGTINAQNQGIIVKSSFLDLDGLIGQTSGLQTNLNRSLVLSGGEVVIENGILKAPSGNIQVAGLSQEGIVDLNYEGSNISITPDSNLMRADIAILKDSKIHIFGEEDISGGSILIYGNKIFVSDSFLSISRDSGNGDLGNIKINSTEGVLINKSSIVASLPNLTEGNAGSILLKGRNISLIGSSIASSSSSFSGNGKGNAGNIEMIADESIHITRGPVSTVISDGKLFEVFDESSLNSTIGFGSAGKGGNIMLKANSIQVEYSDLDASTRTGGSAGNILLHAKFNIELKRSILNSSNWNGQYIGGIAGNVTMQSKKISLSDKTEILSGNIGTDDGINTSGGIIDLNGLESITIDFSRIQSEARASGKLNEDQAGTIIIRSPKILIGNSAEINTKTETNARAGNINIYANDLIVKNSSVIGSFVERETKNAEGGSINIEANNLSILDGGKILTSVLGDLNIPGSGLRFPIYRAGSEGNAGFIVVSVKDSIVISGISSTNKTLRDDEGDSLSPIGSASGIFTTIEAGSLGDSGKISISGSNLYILDSGQIASQNLGIGNSDDINLILSNQLKLINGSLLANSRKGTGGSISISSKTMYLLQNGDIKTDATDNGGNITLTAKSIIALNDSDILAFARDGRGGNVTLNTRAFFGQNYRPAPHGIDPTTLDGNDRVDINASGSLSSGIITRPDTSFIQNSLNQLPNNQIDTNQLLAQTCIIRQDQPEGTFYITGTGGIPNRPNDPALSAYPTNTIQPTTQVAQRPWKLGDPIVEPQGFYQLTDGRFVMSRECAK